MSNSRRPDLGGVSSATMLAGFAEAARKIREAMTRHPDHRLCTCGTYNSLGEPGVKLCPIHMRADG